MKNKIFYIVLFCLSITFAQNRNQSLGSFNQLKVYDGLTLRLIKSNTNKAVITGKYAENVNFVLKNDLLKVKLDIEKYHAGKGTHVDLYYNDLYFIDANEGSFINAKETIKSSNLTVNAQEGAEIDLSIETKHLTVKSISGASIDLEGSSKNQDITANTGGVYNGRKLKTEQSTAVSGTGSTVRLFAKEFAKATAKTGGVIRIYGYPKSIDKKKVLGGTIVVVD